MTKDGRKQIKLIGLIFLATVSPISYAVNPFPTLTNPQICQEKTHFTYGVLAGHFAAFTCCEWDDGECGCRNGAILCCDGQLSFCPCYEES